jgi:hypothetical protein
MVSSVPYARCGPGKVWLNTSAMALRRSRSRSTQRGAAVIALVTIIALGATWYLTSWLREQSANTLAAERVRNAAALHRAKKALIGYVITQASRTGENNPGALPCPEAPASFNATDGTDGSANAAGCALPAIGRFPWRTMGTDKLADAAGEPLWYVVSPGWARTCAGCTTVINSDSAGQLTVDGAAPGSLPAADTVVALIVAPGRAFSVPAASGCSTWNQTRPPTSGVAPDMRNYLECDNANGDSSFVTAGPAGSFNDQVLKITVGDLMPGIEAAVADRVQRTGEFLAQLKTVYTSAGGWGLTGPNALYPFAAPFSNPSGSAMQGAVNTYAGLLPVNFAETSPGSGTPCDPATAGPRCAPSFVAWSGTPDLAGASIYSSDCSATTGTSANCTFYYRCPLLACLLGGTATLNFSFTGTAANAGMALRQLNATTAMTNVDAAGRNAMAVMNNDGSASITLTGTTTVNYGGGLLGNVLCGITGLLALTLGCQQASLAVPILLLADHPALDSTTGAPYGWFLRNKWHEVTYYAVAQNFSPKVRPGQPSCMTGSNCLSVANVAPANGQRAIAILAGRSINGRTRPASTLADYLEFGNAGASYEKLTMRRGATYVVPDSGVANAYVLPVSSVSVGESIVFRALNSNTSAATLSTPATGAVNLVNSDGSTLAAAQVRANAAVLVTYDGSRFLLSTKRPFNDRVLIIDTN